MEDNDNIKAMWNELNQRLSFLEEENKMLMNRVRRSNYKSIREKLSNKYLSFIFLEIIIILFISLFFIFNPHVNEKFRIPALIYWITFFLIEIILDFYLYIRIKDIDIYNSPVNEVAHRAAQNWKLHKTAIILGLPLAFGAALLFAFALDANETIIFGMIFGGLIGLFIGTLQLRKFRNYYKLLTEKE